MDIQKKLTHIQKVLNISQTDLAKKFGVSFVTFNNWRHGKVKPRKKMQDIIDDVYLEVTGQKTVPNTLLAAKKQALKKDSRVYKNITKMILDNSDIRDQYILKLTYHSNGIEGSTLSEPDTASILFDNVVLENKSLVEHLEAKNHQTALLYSLEHIMNKKKIDEHFILRLHSILMNGVRSDAGRYRNHGVLITGVALPTANHLSVSKLLSEVMLTARTPTNDIVALVSKVHGAFEKIHPFSDGNGRVGRLLMNAMFLKENFPPAIIRQEQKRLYYTYLYKAQTSEDQSQLENFLCDTVLESFKIIHRTKVE